MGSFDPFNTCISAARSDVISSLSNDFATLTENLPCGTTKIIDKKTLPARTCRGRNPMIHEYQMESDYSGKAIKSCDDCCTRVYMDININHTAKDHTDFNDGDYFLALGFRGFYQIVDELVNQCFNFGGQNDFDISANSSDKAFLLFTTCPKNKTK